MFSSNCCCYQHYPLPYSNFVKFACHNKRIWHNSQSVHKRDSYILVPKKETQLTTGIAKNF